MLADLRFRGVSPGGTMHLHHVLAAADESDEGRTAIRAASTLAAQTGAHVSFLTVVEGNAEDGNALRILRAAAERQLCRLAPRPEADFAVACGLPSVEITRFSERHAVDLVVAGRKLRPQHQRLLMGDTTDALVRRSRIPCLLVRRGYSGFLRTLAALDGTERGLTVLQAALELVRLAGGQLRAITVESAADEREDPPWIPSGRTELLSHNVAELWRASGLSPEPWDASSGGGRSPLMIQRGLIVEKILAEVARSGADVLALGCHRGGPAGIVEGGSVSRRLLHLAPCAVVTVPL